MKWAVLIFSAFPLLAQILAPQLLFAASVGTGVSVFQPTIGAIQNDYQWFENADALIPSVMLAPENEPATSTAVSGATIRLRVNVKAQETSIDAGTQFKLQFFQATSTATSTGAAWIDVGTSTTIWVLGNNPGIADGQALGETVLSSSTVAQSYVESNPTVGAPNTVLLGGKGEWDFVIKDNGANRADNWYFRLAYISGSELEGYEFSTLPRLRPLTSEKSSSSTISSASGGVQTLMFENGAGATVTIPANYYGETLELRMNSYPSSVFGGLPPPSGKEFIGRIFDFNFYSATTTVASLQATTTITITYQDADVAGFTESTLLPHRMENGSSSWTVVPNSTVDTAANTVTFGTASFSSFALIGDPVSSGSNNGSAGSIGSNSGGGGGGAGISPIANIVFRGIANPGSDVILLEDTWVVATTKAEPDANFEISLSGFSWGTHTLSIRAEDARGYRSPTQTFTVSVTPGATTLVRDIFIPWVIGVEKKGGEILRNGGNEPIIETKIPPQAIALLPVSSTIGLISQRDNDPPESFVPYVTKDDAIFAGKYFLVFGTVDAGTGIDHYEVIEVPPRYTEKPFAPWQHAESPYLLHDQTLSSDIHVRAVDRMGNFIIATIPARFPSQPRFGGKMSVIFLFAAFVAAAFLLRKYKKSLARMFKKTVSV